MDSVANLKKVTVSTGYNAAATSIVLATGQGATLPVAPFNVTWWNASDYNDPSDDPNVEIVRVTGISTDTLTVTRAQESTSASTKNTSGKTYKMILGITAKMVTDLAALIVGNRTSYQNFTTTGSDTTFTLTPPGSATATQVLMLVIGTQQFVQGTDYTVSGNVVTLSSTYPVPSEPVIIIYNY